MISDQDYAEKIKPDALIILSFLIEDTPIEELPQVSGIFVFGHIRPEVACHAAKLYSLGKASRIIIAGKGGKSIESVSGFNTEADYYASLIIKAGVPKKNLILEKKSTNSLENVLFGMKECEKNGFRPNSLILISTPPLLRRSCATFRKQFPKITVWGSACEIPLEEFMDVSKIKRLLGEFNRFQEYFEEGDIERVIIPDEVTQAVKRLGIILKD